MRVKRGEIYEFYFGPVTEEGGSEQRGVRPAVIIQNDTGNMCSPTLIVAPISVSSRPIFPTHVDLSKVDGLVEGSKAMLEQIRTIDKRYIVGDRMSILGDGYMKQINRAIKISLGLG